MVQVNENVKTMTLEEMLRIRPEDIKNYFVIDLEKVIVELKNNEWKTKRIQNKNIWRYEYYG